MGWKMNKTNLFILCRLTIYALVLTRISSNGDTWTSIGLGIGYALIELMWYLNARNTVTIQALAIMNKAHGEAIISICNTLANSGEKGGGSKS
jgi:hypothetical protein